MEEKKASAELPVTTVKVALTVDLEEAERAGQLLLASNLLARFKQEGEDWQREAAGDPLLARFLRVEVRSSQQPAVSRQ